MNKILRFAKNPWYRKIDSIKDWYYLFRSNYFAFRYGLDFIEINDMGIDEVNSQSKEHGNEYRNGSFYYCKLMLDLINVDKYKYNFIDIGSGKGKICFEVARKYKFSKIIGVEYERCLVDVANQNKKLLKDDGSNFVCEDASSYILPNGNNVIFIFNSFDEFVLKRFLDINMENMCKYKNIILYASNIHRDVFLINGAKVLYEDLNRRLSVFVFE
jgi:hypothetical protein